MYPEADYSELSTDVEFLSPTLAVGRGIAPEARILIVDDCALYRECLVGVLAARPGVSAPGVAWDLKSLIVGIQTTHPDVILLNMATHESAMLLRQALQLNPGVRVVVSGVSDEDESGIVECAEAGAAGYHLRAESLNDLLVLIQNVAEGRTFCSPKVSAILLRRLSLLAAQRRQPEARDSVLTAREIQILRMLESGLANRDIAERLCIAVHTVKNHVHSVLTKLGVSSRAQAAALARNMRAAGELAPN
ncbi:DNA-binding NarL/FixJ family response regulator [Mycobacterium sp. BK558]|nr:DNA-binding NarL/FixJ family response regulator [Mycobacterium sp. BK558]